MEDNFKENVICCFCGESLKIQKALVLNVQPNIDSEESQCFFAHKQHFIEKICKAIPLNPDFFEDESL